MITKLSIAKAKRFDFLVRKKLQWQGVVSRSFLDTTPESNKVVAELAREMQKLGLYSPKTYIKDIEISVFKHIQSIRRSIWR